MKGKGKYLSALLVGMFLIIITTTTSAIESDVLWHHIAAYSILSIFTGYMGYKLLTKNK